MLAIKAKEYLEAVIDHKRCIPFLKYNGSTGRTGQAKEFKTTKGRWPEKSCRFVLDLLTNLLANAETNNLDKDKLVISGVRVNEAVKGRRRTYRAHGRINAYMSCNSHVELTGAERIVEVKREKRVQPEVNLNERNPKQHIRRAVARHLRSKKLVPVGKAK